MTTELWLTCSAYTEVTQEANIEDSWSRDSTATSWTFDNLSVTRPIYGFSELASADFEVKPGDVVHVVVAVWSTGDSFGHDEGAQCEVFGVYKDLEKAKACEEALEKATEYELIIKTESGKTLKLHCPWHGYFESLDYVQVLTMTVQ